MQASGIIQTAGFFLIKTEYAARIFRGARTPRVSTETIALMRVMGCGDISVTAFNSGWLRQHRSVFRFQTRKSSIPDARLYP
jgi:hypothetical protein